VAVSEQTYSFDDLVPCNTYAFAVSTVVNGDESVPTEYQSVLVKPDTNVVPELTIVSPEGDNVTVKVQPSEPNKNCLVSRYEVRYAVNGGDTAGTKNIEGDQTNGDIVLPVTQQDAYIVAKLQYVIEPACSEMNCDMWTKSVSIGDPGPMSPLVDDQDPAEMGSLLIPVVVAVAVLAIIVIVVTVLVLRRKRSMRSFDAEKGASKAENGKSATAKTETTNGGGKASTLNANDEETQKLNANHDDPDNFA